MVAASYTHSGVPWSAAMVRSCAVLNGFMARMVPRLCHLGYDGELQSPCKTDMSTI